MSALTLAEVALALRALQVMPNGSTLDEHAYRVWHTLLASESVTATELHRALFDVMKRQKFFPAPADVLEAVKAHRQADYLARQAEEREERTRTYREAIPAPVESAAPAGEVASLEGLPVPPPREPLPAQVMQDRGMFGPVRLPDGRLDPRWPEIKGREAAWRRKMQFDHGLISYRSATAPNVRDARIEETLAGKVGR